MVVKPEATTRYVLQKKLFLKISQYSQKIPVLESLFNKVAGQETCNFIKKETPTQVFSCKCCKTFKNTYFEKHLWTAASLKRFLDFFLACNKPSLFIRFCYFTASLISVPISIKNTNFNKIYSSSHEICIISAWF